MSRVPGTFGNGQTWELIDNPGYDGEPRILRAACHDKTPFLTVACGCGAALHMHESQVKGREGYEIATHCPQCSHEMVFPPGFVHAAFAQMRADGWIE